MDKGLAEFLITILTSLALIISAGLPLVSFRSRRWAQRFSNLAWLSMGLGFVLVYLGSAPYIALVLSVASLAGSASIDGRLSNGELRGAVCAFSATPPFVLAFVAMYFALWGPKTVSQDNPEMLLLWTAYLALFVAALSGGFAAMAAHSMARLRCVGGAEPWILPLGGLASGLALIGLYRTDLPGWHYTVELLHGSESVWWNTPKLRTGVSPIQLRVVGEIPDMWFGLGGVIGAGLLGYLASWWTSRKASFLKSTAYGLVALSGLGILASAMYRLDRPFRPRVEPYLEYAKVIGARLKIPTDYITQGQFTTKEPLGVALHSILPELTVGWWLVVFGSLLWFVSKRQGAMSMSQEVTLHFTRVADLSARDYLLRAVLYLSMGWMLSLLITWNHHGSLTLGSPVEWLFFGLVWTGYGFVFLKWVRTESLILLRLQRASVFLWVGLILAYSGLCLAFGIFPGLPLALVV